jgi:hypothetical protein
MSVRPNIVIVKEAAEKLVQLTSDPHPGLETWHTAVQTQLKILSDIYNG